MQTLRAILRTLRLALPKIGVGWMFALLTIDFNRIAIVELGVTAVIVTTMLAMHYFLSPFQVVFGRIADRFPVMGYRRTPFILAGSVISSLLFLALPSVAEAMGAGSTIAIAAGFVLFILFGISMAMIGDSHHSLIAEVTTERSRGGVISVVWIVTIMSTILAAVVMNAVRPEYTPEAMQTLYNLTPFIVIGASFLGIVGLERRLTGEELEQARQRAIAAAPPGNPVAGALRLLGENPQTRGFFAFIFLAILAIFLQDNILEVFGAEVFGMTVAETTKFQPTWGAGVLVGMVVMGIVSVVTSLAKKTIAMIGCAGIAVGMLALASSALMEQSIWVRPALFGLGIFTGIFNVGSLSMMMDMTIEGATGLYMGLWGVAQAFGTGIASMGSGALHTTLIESGAMTPAAAYSSIFAFEAAAVTVAGGVLYHISVRKFRDSHANGISREDLARAMEAGSTA